MRFVLILALALASAFTSPAAVLGKITATTVKANNVFLVNSNLDLTALPGEILYVDARQGVTNASNAIAGNNQEVKGWRDLSGNTFPLLNLSAANYATNFAAGGPLNGPYVDFNSSFITNGLGGTNISQPVTYFFVMQVRTPTTTGYWLNGQPGQVPQWNESTGGGGTLHLYAGIDQSIVNAGNQAAYGWPAGNWSIVTIQFNGASSRVRVNGTPFPLPFPATPDLGSTALKGITLGCAYNFGGTFARQSMAALVIVGGSTWTDPAKLLQVEESIGSQFGINVP